MTLKTNSLTITTILLLVSFFLGIAPVDAQVNGTLQTAQTARHHATQAPVNCNSNSRDCCWVIRSWQLMGKTTSVPSTSSTACCSNLGSTGIPGVHCSADGKVTEINWKSKSLKGEIPDSFGQLQYLQRLSLHFNRLIGSIPSSLASCTNLLFL
jgi:hypothetical protein